MPTIVVFGSSLSVPYSTDYEAAEELGGKLAAKGFNIATGGYGGTMEAVLKGASEYGVKRLGVVLSKSELKINDYVQEKIFAETYLERLNLLIELGDIFIILPGGTGTLLELSAVWALKERGFVNKPIVCYGEIWYEMLQTMGFYSEKFLESSSLLKIAVDMDKIIEFVDQAAK